MNKKYNIFSKLNFEKLPLGKINNTLYKDDNKYSNFNWSFATTELNEAEIKETNGVKILNLKSNNSKLFNTDNILGMINTNFKGASLQVEMNISIPSFKPNNIYFNIASSSNAGFRFDIQKTRLEILCNNKKIVCAYNFVENKIYNVIISKISTVYFFIIDGMMVGKIDSIDFTNNINNGLDTITIGADTSGYTTSVWQFNGYISNVNLSYGNFVKYTNAFTKYGENLLSRYNFNNYNVSNTTTYFCDIESVYLPKLTWVLDKPIDNNLNGYYKVNGNKFTSTLPNIFTLMFNLKNTFNTNEINLVDLGDYKIKYNYIKVGAPEPEVIVNEFTKSALDFENGIVDKIATTTWDKEGTAVVQSVNKIFGDSSFETKALGDSLKTSSALLTGNGTPFTVEYHFLYKAKWTPEPVWDAPIFTRYSAGDIGNYLNTTTYNISFHSVEMGLDNSNIIFGKTKLKPNEINKVTMSYDGSSIRMFINDQLDNILGTSTGFITHGTQPYRFFSRFADDQSINNLTSTSGLLDNINIFDGVATKVRNVDPYEENLVVDLALDGENNSTKIVDNGKLQNIWTSYNNAKLNTNKKFDGFSSLYVDSGGCIQTILKPTSVLNLSDFTITIDVFTSSFNGYPRLFQFGSNNQKGCLILYGIGTTSYIHAQISLSGGNYSNIVSVTQESYKHNKENNITLVRKDGVFYFYVNNILCEINDNFKSYEIDTELLTLGANGVGTEGLTGYIKNFKIYKGIAIIPESPVGKIQLDFDNNLNDNYNNSTWVNNGVTFDQVNSVKGYAAYFDGTTQGIYSESNSNLNYENKNFNIEFDTKQTGLGGQYNSSMLNSNQVTNYVPFSISIGNGASNIFVNYNNGTSNYGLSALMPNELNQYKNLKLFRKDGVSLIKINDTIKSAVNIPKEYNINLNGGDKSFIGSNRNDLSGTFYKGYIDNFKSIKNYQGDYYIDNTAVHLPFETNSNNIGFTNLNVSAVGSPTYHIIDGKKCIKFESGKYLSIPTNNIFNLGTSSDFYIEFDFYPTLDSYHCIFLNGTTTTSPLISLSLGNNTMVDGAGIHRPNSLYVYHKDLNSSLITKNPYIINTWNNIKFYRKNGKTILDLNNIKTEFSDVYNLDFSYNDTYFAKQFYATANDVDFKGYMSNFKMFVGTSKVPETYNDKKVLNLDFNPTRKSYLFKDNNNKCVIHPVNITQRDYQDSKYCCYFNGTDQYLQLGKNDLLNFGNDDFIIEIIFESTSITRWHMLLSDYASSTNFIDIGSNGYIAVKVGGTRYDTPPNIILPNVKYKLLLKCVNGKMSLFINDNLTTLDNLEYQNVSNVNFNLGNNTFIGTYGYAPTSELFTGNIYSIKVLRNTNDLTLLDDEDVIYSLNETFSLTNGNAVDDKVISFDTPMVHDLQIVSDNQNLTMIIDDETLILPKSTNISNAVLFDGYKGDVKDIRVYDKAFLDQDVFMGSVLSDTEYPELEMFVEDVDDFKLDVIDIGDYVLKGFIEGYTDRKFNIFNKSQNYILLDGVEDYEYNGINFDYFNEYEIHDLVNGQRYPLYTHEMVKGFISGTVNLKNCGVKSVDMKVYCYRNDNSRLIGVYDLKEDGTYSIPNLDVNSYYDIVFKDQNRKIENISSSYRKPKSY